MFEDPAHSKPNYERVVLVARLFRMIPEGYARVLLVVQFSAEKTLDPFSDPEHQAMTAGLAISGVGLEPRGVLCSTTIRANQLATTLGSGLTTVLEPKIFAEPLLDDASQTDMSLRALPALPVAMCKTVAAQTVRAIRAAVKTRAGKDIVCMVSDVRYALFVLASRGRWTRCDRRKFIRHYRCTGLTKQAIVHEFLCRADNPDGAPLHLAEGRMFMVLPNARLWLPKAA